MSAERNLWCGLCAWESGLINTGQLVEACKLWNAAPERPIEDLFLERGWINKRDRAALGEQLAVHISSVSDGSAPSEAETVPPWPVIPEYVKRLLAALGDPAWQAAVARAPVQQGAIDTVVLPGEQIASASVDLHDSGPRYTLVSLHASGGMGQVWLARDENIGRDVAIKELRAELTRVAALPERFIREARITGQLEHPGIIPVYELGRHPDGQPYYAMRYVRGQTLTQASQAYHRRHSDGQDDPLELVQLLSAFVSVCNTVAYAHSHGIIHRDLKGENVVLGDFGEVIVLDWGLAKRVSEKDDALQAGGQSAGHDGDAPADTAHTMMGQIIGTPGYMAPEQAEGRLDLIGPHTDIFGLGAMLYELLTGHPPFAGKSTVDVLRRTKRGDFPTPRTVCPDVPVRLEQTCLKALSTDPAQRHATAAELGREVQGWQDRQRREAEQALAQNRRLLQAMVDNSPEIMFAKDLEGRYILINKSYESTFNVDRATYVGQTDFSLFPPAMAEQYRANDRKVLESGEALTVEEFDEKHIWISVKFPILDLNGKPWAVGGMSCDVTALRKLERAFEASRAQCQALLALSDHPTLVFDSEARVTAANPAACQLLQRTANELTSLHCLGLGWANGEDGAAFTAESHPVLLALQSNPAPSSSKVLVRLGTGAEEYALTIEPLRAAGQPAGVACKLTRQDGRSV